MKNRIVKLNEFDLERLVKKIIKEEENENKPTITRHPAYPIIDTLESTLDTLKTNFKRDIANKVSGEDGYHSEIDKFVSDFNKFIGKVSDLKGKINDYEIQTKGEKARKKEKMMQEKKKMHHQRVEKARREGKNYSY